MHSRDAETQPAGRMMRTVFADSFYFFALGNRQDSAHGEALEFSRRATKRSGVFDGNGTEGASHQRLPTPGSQFRVRSFHQRVSGLTQCVYVPRKARISSTSRNTWMLC